MKNESPTPKKTPSRFTCVTALLVTCGCQSVSYTGPNGERFTRSSFGCTTSLASLSVVTDTNGLRRVELRGYTNDSAAALGIVTEAAIRAALHAVKP